MDAKFFNGLFEGDSPNGVKLGMGLTGGDYWPRPAGCMILHRGRRWFEVDFGTIVSFAELPADRILSTAEHLPGQTCVYVVRGVNGCGEDAMSLAPMVQVTFDAAGDLQGPRDGGILALCARQVAPLRVRLMWLYTPYRAPTPCARFDVHTDGGTGRIDPENLVATVLCSRAGIYTHELTAPQPGRHRFAVRCQSRPSAENIAMCTTIDLAESAPNNVAQLNVKEV